MALCVEGTVLSLQSTIGDSWVVWTSENSLNLFLNICNAKENLSAPHDVGDLEPWVLQ